jgi:hypothetical protein
MKFIFSTLILSFCCALLSTAHAYEARPDRLMVRAHQAIKKNDLKIFNRIFGRAALCHWGNTAGLATLKENLPSSARNIISEITIEQQGHLTQARFVGFWAYYEQVYSLKVMDKSRTLLAEGKIECHHGLESTRRDNDLNRQLAHYNVKNCRVVIFEARTFPNPALRSECAIFGRP